MKNNGQITAWTARDTRCKGRNRYVLKRALFGMALLVLHSPFLASVCRAQEDSAKINKLTIDLQFLAHGEICAGGLPKPPATDNPKPEEDFSAFLLGRTRLGIGYERK